jgi:hypothetical protein
MRGIASQPLGHGTRPTCLSRMIFDVRILFFLHLDIVGSPPALTTGNSRALAGEGPEVVLADAYFLIELPILIV